MGFIRRVAKNLLGSEPLLSQPCGGVSAQQCVNNGESGDAQQNSDHTEQISAEDNGQQHPDAREAD